MTGQDACILNHSVQSLQALDPLPKSLDALEIAQVQRSDFEARGLGAGCADDVGDGSFAFGHGPDGKYDLGGVEACNVTGSFEA